MRPGAKSSDHQIGLRCIVDDREALSMSLRRFTIVCLTVRMSKIRKPGRDSAKSSRAFSILELLAVIAVIAILVGLTFGVSGVVRRRAAESKALGELSVLAQALEEYRGRFGDYPWIRGGGEGHRDLYGALLGMQRPDGKATATARASTSAASKPFIDLSHLSIGGAYDAPRPTIVSGILHSADANYRENFLVDPWGQPYVYLYKTIGAGGSWKGFGFILLSVGFDGNGGSADVSNGIVPQDYREYEGAADNLFPDG
jgi:prepilin-type N-terminal cleavage/methylation domain-containing protein